MSINSYRNVINFFVISFAGTALPTYGQFARLREFHSTPPNTLSTADEWPYFTLASDSRANKQVVEQIHRALPVSNLVYFYLIYKSLRNIPIMAHVVNIEEIPDYQAEEARPSEVEATPQRKNILPLKILCILLVLMVSLGWVGIIVQLIMKEEWQLVMVAWLLLYAAAHFCYWYCRRHSSREQGATVRK